MPTEEISGSYTPAAPITASISSILSQDVITTNTIPVDTNSPSPVGAFNNPNSGGSGTAQIEALGVVTPTNASGPQLAHIARSTASESGWVVNALFNCVSVLEVTAGTAYASQAIASVYGFYIDATGIWWTQLASDGVTWSQPQQAWAGSASNIGVAYTPFGGLVIYANTGGDLVTVTQSAIGGSFAGSVTSMDKQLSTQFVLTMESQTNWWVSANQNGQLVIYSGQIGATQYTGMNTDTGFTTTLQQVVLGYYTQNTLMCFAIDTANNMHVWSSSTPGSAGATLQQIPNSTVASATAHVSTDHSIHIYSIDTDQNLWVLHQDPSAPFTDGIPNFIPYIPLDTSILGVVSDMNPADAPTLFALDAADGSLRLHAQDPSTLMWSSGQLLQASDEVYPLTRYRTEVSLVDANGAPVANYPVSVQVAPNYSAADVWVAGSTYSINSSTPVQLTTDSLGKVTMAMLPMNGLAAPMFTVTAESLTPVDSFSPALPIHTYLSGNGILYPTQPTTDEGGGPLPVFDAAGQTLATAQKGTLAPLAANDSTMAGVAAGAIINVAQTALGTNTSPGFSGSFEQATFRQFATADEMRAVLGDRAQPDSILSAISNFFGDIWQGIKKGVIKIVDFVVSVADKIANFTVRLLNGIEQAVQTVITGLEEAAQFIAGVFQAVEAAVEKVVDWLKALFDFAAIWRTKMAFQQMLLAAPAYISGIAANASQIADGWFQNQETAVQTAFANWAAQYAPPGQSFSAAPGWQTPGQPSTTPVANGASPADLTNNAHHNWLQNKVSSGAPSSLGVNSNAPSPDPWTNFENAMSTAGTDLLAALQDFLDGIAALLGSDPNQIGNVAMSDFITGIGNLISAALSLADGVVSFVAGLADSGMTALQALLENELDLGFLNKLWAWLASEAGYPDDSTLTIAALASLIAAFPTTIIYKLIEGVDNEPFPASSTLSLAHTLSTMPAAAVLCGAILDVLYVIPQIASDVMSTPPQWLAIGMLGLTIIIWVLENGLPDWSTIEWASAGAVVGNLLWLIPVAAMIVKAGAPEFYKDYITSGDAQNLFFTLVGIGQEVFSMMAILDTPGISTAQSLTDFFSPLSNLFSFLGCSTFKDDPAAPIFTTIKVVMDFISYVGGGVSEIEVAVG